MSSLGALSRRKGLKRGVLYVFCTFLPAFWSSQFPTSDSSAGWFLSAGSVFLSPRCGFGGESKKNFILEACKSWRGSFRQVGWAAPGEAGQSRSGRWWVAPSPAGWIWGLGRCLLLFSAFLWLLAWTVTQASSSAPSCLDWHIFNRYYKFLHL